MAEQHFEVIVIGAGAAGMMCAAQAGQRGRRVLLIDHAEHLAEKIRISGGGRCNFTNRRVGPEHYLSQNPHFVRSALSRYGSTDFIALVERHGIRYHERDHGHLFCNDSAQQIIDMLRGEGDTGFVLDTALGRLRCDSLVVATGGLSIPKQSLAAPLS